MAVDNKDGIKPLVAETFLFPLPTGTVPPCRVPAEMVAPWNVARGSANALIAECKIGSGREMTDILSKKAKVFDQLDRTFRIELGWITSMAESGGASQTHTLHSWGTVLETLCLKPQTPRP